ncbi:MAG: hypothetical protein ACK5W0_07245 [Labrys sp. (in: a-proteobacteria)]
MISMNEATADDAQDMSMSVTELHDRGYAVLRAVFPPNEIAAFREVVLANLAAMAKTRRIDHAYHLAGFHRHASFRPLHERIANEPAINRFLAQYYTGTYRTIGLTDITINRSQHWHTDLLRGAYGGFLADGSPWRDSANACLKALVYLQPGRRLHIVSGSHRTPSPLDDDALEALANKADPISVQVEAGDVVMMDIRALHRGATDAEMSDPALVSTPKILVSTVFGLDGSRFAEAMEAGNAKRLADWDMRYFGKALATAG